MLPFSVWSYNKELFHVYEHLKDQQEMQQKLLDHSRLFCFHCVRWGVAAAPTATAGLFSQLSIRHGVSDFSSLLPNVFMLLLHKIHVLLNMKIFLATHMTGLTDCLLFRVSHSFREQQRKEKLKTTAGFVPAVGDE